MPLPAESEALGIYIAFIYGFKCLFSSVFNLHFESNLDHMLSIYSYM